MYFNKFNGTVPEHIDKVLSLLGGEGVQQCLDVCLDHKDFRCNSFYYCPDSSQCLLSKDPVPDGDGATTAQRCSSYSSKGSLFTSHFCDLFSFRVLKVAIV